MGRLTNSHLRQDKVTVSSSKRVGKSFAFIHLKLIKILALKLKERLHLGNGNTALRWESSLQNSLGEPI